MASIILSAIERRGQSQEGIPVKYIQLLTGDREGKTQSSRTAHLQYLPGNLRRIVLDFPDSESCNDCY